MKKFKELLLLFWTFFKIGIITFGGGYAMVAIIEREFVERKKWLTEEEFTDVLAVAESTPGPISVNSATFIGYKRGGVLGSLLSTLAVTLPSFIIIFVISLFLDEFMKFELVQKAFKGIQCAVAVLVISSAFKLSKGIEWNVFNIILIVISAAAMLAIDIFTLDISTIFIILFGAIVGIIVCYIPKKKVEKSTYSATYDENDSKKEGEE